MCVLCALWLIIRCIESAGGLLFDIRIERLFWGIEYLVHKLMIDRHWVFFMVYGLLAWVLGRYAILFVLFVWGGICNSYLKSCYIHIQYIYIGIRAGWRSTALTVCTYILVLLWCTITYVP